MKLDNDLYQLMSGIQDILIQAAQVDGFTPSDPITWNFVKSAINKAFQPSLESTGFELIDFTKRDSGTWFYEQVLFSSTIHGELDCDSDDISVTYSINDTHKGIIIRGKIKCYIRHPEDYKQALRDAGALHYSTYTSESVACGV